MFTGVYNSVIKKSLFSLLFILSDHFEKRSYAFVSGLLLIRLNSAYFANFLVSNIFLHLNDISLNKNCHLFIYLMVEYALLQYM